MTKLILFLAILLSFFFSSVCAQSAAEKYYYNGEYQQAIQVLETIIDKGKAESSDYRMIANCYEQLFDYGSAIENYKLGLAIYPKNQFLVEGLATANLSLGNKKEALLGYSHLENLGEYDRRIQGKKAGILMDLNRYAEANTIYNTLYAADSSNVYFLRRLMQSIYKLQNYAYVIDLYKNNSFVPSTNKEIQMMAADSYFKINNNIEALGILNQILALDSLYVPAISKIAYIHFASYRNYEDAVVFYRLLNELENFTDPFHLKNLGICEYFTGNQEFAAVLLDSLTKVIENDAFIPFYAGLSYNKLGDVDKALELLERSVSMVIPAYTSDVYHHLGRAFAAKRMFVKALATYQKVREYDPANYQVLYDIAVTYEEYNMNRTLALGYYQQFVKECTNYRSSDLRYAENRIKMIKEELFFEGE